VVNVSSVRRSKSGSMVGLLGVCGGPNGDGGNGDGGTLDGGVEGKNAIRMVDSKDGRLRVGDGTW